MTEELKSKIVWQEDKDFGKVCTLTESALNDIINEATKELQEEMKGQKEYIKYLKRQRQGGIQKQYNKVEKIKELEKQIEKMKCCYNCSKWNDGECKDCPSPIYTMADFNCDKWELAE